MTTPLRMIWATCVCCAIATGTNYGADSQFARSTRGATSGDRLAPTKYPSAGSLANSSANVSSTNPASLPAPWTAQDVGTTGIAGTTTYADGKFTIAGGGADIGGTSDAFRWVSQPSSGDVEIVARVTSLQNTNAHAKAGVMLRETSAAGSADVLLDVRPNGSIEFMTRSTTGAGTDDLAGSTLRTPTWLRLARTGGQVTAAISADGIVWTTIGSTTPTMSQSALIGLAVTSHNTSRLNTATFDNVVVRVPALPPTTASSPAPPTGATGVPFNVTLAWSAPGATSYDVNFGTTNPPATAATGLANAAYSVSGLQAATTYFWQVIARNSAGATTAPVWSFKTGVATTAAVAPIVYNAITDRNTYVKPALPQLGAAGFTFNDPVFGSKILRVTDGNTRPGATNRSYRVASNAHLSGWNASSTMFYVLSNDGTSIPYTFDPAAMTASRIHSGDIANGGMTMQFYGEPQFSIGDRNTIYGVQSGGNNRTIGKYDFSAGVYSPIVDLDTIVAGLSGTYVGGLLTGNRVDEKLATFFGGTQQDTHFYVMWSAVTNIAARKIVNTHTSTINGVPNATVLNFNIHSASIDKSGRYVMIYPTAPDLAPPRSAAHVYIWDTTTDAIVPMTTTNGGHDAAGYGYSVNHDCCTSSTWDGMQFEFRYLADPATTNDLISPVLTPKEIYIDDHTTWNNARPDALVPVISSTYRYGSNTAAWRAWDDEIIGIDTTGGIGGVVYRFAHHRSDSGSDADPTTPYFWYEPIANVSPDGRWVLFTSNWEKTLGRDSAEGTARQDVFLVQLTPQ